MRQLRMSDDDRNFPFNGCEKRCHWYHNDSSCPQHVSGVCTLIQGCVIYPEHLCYEADATGGIGFGIPLVAGATRTAPAPLSVGEVWAGARRGRAPHVPSDNERLLAAVPNAVSM